MRHAVAAAAATVALVAASATPAGATIARCPAYEPLLAAAGLPVRQFSALMWRESRCRARATHVNRNGTVDRGLLQINSVHLRRGGAAGGLAPGALYNPSTNVAVAARLYRRAGGRPWAL